MTADPTYVRDLIEAKPDWALAFWMSEILNDNAPLGWGFYLPLAQALLRKYDVTPKVK